MFDERLRLVGVHNSRGGPAGDGRVPNNQGIPIKAILKDLDPRVRALLITPRCEC